MNEKKPRGEMTGAELSVMAGCRAALIGIAVFSALINVLYLTGSFYMLQVYDRVIPSRSVPTLIALSLLAAILFAGQAALDFYRTRLLSRVARALADRVSPLVFRLVAHLPLTGSSSGLQPLHDLDRVRGFLAGGGPLGFFDLPWMPFYIGICFLFHPAIGLLALGGALLLAVLALWTELATRAPMTTTASEGVARATLAEASRRNAEVIAAMGITRQLQAKWIAINERHLDGHQRASDVASGLGGVSKVVRMALQSGVLGLGAFLVIKGEASPGVIIAGSILSARALAPVEHIIGHWKAFAGARQSWTRLQALLAQHPGPAVKMALRRPSTSLTVETVGLAPPGHNALVVHSVSFRVQAGSALGVIGPSGSGKSSLARALVGVWTPVRGKIRLDGATLDQWPPEALGRHIGYLPQDVELFEGTIAENISRFEPDASAKAIISAAEQAGVHDLILRLPAGYETLVGEAGMSLSGGQRQRIGLARALYNEPFLVVLDEPNSNLDQDGDVALSEAIRSVRTRGGIVVVIAHRASALAAVDLVLVMAEGTPTAFGARDDVLRKALRPVPAPPVQNAIAGAAS